MFFLDVKNSNGESYVPPAPSPNKTLPANDGGVDGCDSSRFKCVMAGEAVLDKQTGLTWARKANVANKKLSWQDAVGFCQNLKINNQEGWRLPTKEELISILDTSQSDPALPEGHPFLDVRGVQGGSAYWTSTDYKDDINTVWIIGMSFGKVQDSLKLFDYGIWPVLDSN